MHTYPGITPWNVGNLEMDLINDLIAAATAKPET
jgi:hypothetical protein